MATLFSSTGLPPLKSRRERSTALPILEVPSRYRVPTRGEARIDVEGRTVRECILEVEGRFPGFQELILDTSGKQKRFVRFFLNGDALERDSLDRPLSQEDTLTIMASAAGG
ncbi:MAG TPA: MoaD/ThiS family protein [Myxococcales bacterium]|nr:MoaD/ThiS family protein [Myxococcales bacterium]